MMTNKNELGDESFDPSVWDKIKYELYVKSRINNSIQAAEKKKIISHKDAKREILNEN
jgi:hypothetical protein